MLQDGKSDFEARKLLIDRLDDIHARMIPPLPPGEYLWLHDKITKAKAPFQVSQPTVETLPNTAPVKAMTVRQKRKAKSDERKAAIDEFEAKVIKWLAEKPDIKKAPRKLYMKVCLETFQSPHRLSVRGYDRCLAVAQEKISTSKRHARGKKKQKQK